MGTHYDEKGECVEKIPVDRACNSSRQCTDHALCSAQHGDTCFCMAGYYGADGKCNSVIPEGDTCTGKWLGTCLSACLSVCQPVHLTVCLSVNLTLSQPVHLTVC